MLSKLWSLKYTNYICGFFFPEKKKDISANLWACVVLCASALIASAVLQNNSEIVGICMGIAMCPPESVSVRLCVVSVSSTISP